MKLADQMEEKASYQAVALLVEESEVLPVAAQFGQELVKIILSMLLHLTIAFVGTESKFGILPGQFDGSAAFMILFYWSIDTICCSMKPVCTSVDRRSNLRDKPGDCFLQVTIRLFTAGRPGRP